MRNMQKRLTPYPLIALLCILILAACASIGSPDGGAYDETPPKVVKCQPANMSVNNRDKKLTLTFDEFIVLENASEKVVVSPPQKEMPEIRTSGKRIHITLNDSLKENTTYTVDFSDAIVDNNEGNPMGNFTYAFSTGTEIDTMEVSGTLLEAENLEPIKGMLVGLYADLSDSAFTTQSFTRVSRTNSRGQFTIKGVAPGKYRIYGLQDMDGDFRFSQKAEKIAFDSVIIEPTCAPDTRQDTVWIDSTHIDTIKTIPYTHFYPDNVILRGFTEDYQDLHLLKTERPIPDMFTIYFTGPSDTLPTLKGLNFEGTEDMILERSSNNDTLTYWITDTLVSNKDTLTFSLTYLDTDTLGQLTYRTDTLDLIPKVTRTQQVKERQKKIEEWEDQQKKAKRRQKEKYVAKSNPFLREDLTYKMQPTGGIAPTQNIKFTFAEPIAGIDTTALHFYKQKELYAVRRVAPWRQIQVRGGQQRSNECFGKSQYSHKKRNPRYSGRRIQLAVHPSYPARHCRYRTTHGQQRQGSTKRQSRKQPGRLLLSETGRILPAPFHRPKQRRKMDHRRLYRKPSAGRSFLLPQAFDAKSPLGSRTRLGRERHSIEQTEAGSHHQTKTGCRQENQTT